MKEPVWDPQQFKDHFEKGTDRNKILASMEKRKLDFYLTRLQFQPSDTVLDIGCGYGRFAMHIRDQVKGIVGIDINPDNITYAKHYVGEKFQGQVVDLSRGQLPFENNAFDKIIMDNVLTFLNREQQVLLFKEIRRVLRPNGVVAFNVANSAYIFSLLHKMFTWLYAVKARTKGVRVPTHHAYDLEFYEKTLHDVGFKTIESVGDTYYRKMGLGKIEVMPGVIHNSIIRWDVKSFNSANKKKMSSITLAVS